jgi:hypothetical protein
MKLQVKTDGCALTPTDEAALARHIERLRPWLSRFEPDLVHLEVTIEKQPRRVEYAGSIRLVVMEHVLAAQRNAAPAIRTLLNRSFEDLREQLARMHAQLRLEPEWERRRGARDDAGAQDADRTLTELRAALDQALADGPTAYSVLADTRLPGVRRVIFEILTADGRQPTDEDLARALQHTVAVAQQELRTKPESWTLYGWLAWIARRELARGVRGAA